MGPNSLSAKPVAMPATDLTTPAQKQVASSAVTKNIKINYGDEAKVNRLSNTLDKVKVLQGSASEHVERVKSKIIM